MSLEKFCESYIETALWSSTDNADDSGGEPLDKNYSADDIAPSTMKQMVKDCKAFYESERKSLAVGTDGQGGHDFWLTRNGHGAGFWDGDWPEPEATKLTKASKAYGSYDLYVGDDGKIHGS